MRCELLGGFLERAQGEEVRIDPWWTMMKLESPYRCLHRWTGVVVEKQQGMVGVQRFL